jgi:hypothetical protein
MAYSAVNAGADEGDDSIFSSGGAIMDALNQNDPVKEEVKKTKKDTKTKLTQVKHKNLKQPKKAAKV